MADLENIFEPLEGMQKASPKPFLATRVKARLKKSTAETAVEKVLNWLLKPAMIATIVLLVVVAQYTILNQDNTTNAELTEEVADNDFDISSAFSNINTIDDEK